MPKQTNKRRSTRPRQQRRHNTNNGAPSNGNQSVVEPTTTNYADLSTEVLHLLLAQRNLSLAGSRATILRRLAEHDRAENSAAPAPSEVTPTSTTPTNTTPTSHFSAESLRSLASDLAPLLRDVLARENNSSQSASNPPPLAEDFPAQTVPTQSLDLGNPSHVAALISTQQAPSPASNVSASLDTASLPKKLEDQILSGEFVDFTLLLPGNSDRPTFGPIRLSVEGDREFSIPIPNFSNFGKRPKIDSIDKWLTAFGIYASIVVEKFPHKASQFFAYQRIIREASKKFTGLA